MPGQRAATSTWLVAVVALTTLLPGCVTQPVEGEAAEPLQSAERYTEAARSAFEEGLYEQAEALYRQALEQSYTRDDQVAIVDAQYNLAVTLLRLGRYDEALERVRQAQAETVRGGRAVSADMLLLEATLLYRMERPGDALEVSRRIVSGSSASGAGVVKRARFLRGLIAAEAGDQQQLRTELSALGEPSDPRLLGDQQELVGFLAWSENDLRSAGRAFDRSALLRSETLDYRGLVRTLANAGEVYAQAGNPGAAAERFLRAGRSAALQGVDSPAEAWLRRAVTLAAESDDPLLAEEAEEHLRRLRESEG